MLDVLFISEIANIKKLCTIRAILPISIQIIRYIFLNILYDDIIYLCPVEKW